MNYSEAKHPLIYSGAHRVTEWREGKIRDMKVRGTEFIPDAGARLIGFSHREASDPRVAGTSIPGRPVALMAKDELWKLKYFYAGYLLQLIDAFPVNRDKPGHSTIRYAGKLLTQGRLVGAFGEGSRYEDEKLKILRGETIGKIRPGLGLLAVKYNIGIIPVGISHLTQDEIAEYGRDIKRVVIGTQDYPNSELPFKQAIADISERHRSSLQAVFDEAQAWARSDAQLMA